MFNPDVLSNLHALFLFCFGGSMFISGPKSTIPVPGFIQQIEGYYISQHHHIRKPELAKTLFAINLQGNEWSFNQATNPQTVVDNLERGIRRLVSLGATRFLFFKNQDYGLIPYVVNNATVSQLMSGVAAVQSRGEDVMLAKLDNELGSKTKSGCRSHHGSHEGIDIKVVDIAEVYMHLREPRQMRRIRIRRAGKRGYRV